jgi:hypothetical protein
LEKIVNFSIKRLRVTSYGFQKSRGGLASHQCINSGRVALSDTNYNTRISCHCESLKKDFSILAVGMLLLTLINALGMAMRSMGVPCFVIDSMDMPSADMDKIFFFFSTIEKIRFDALLKQKNPCQIMRRLLPSW